MPRATAASGRGAATRAKLLTAAREVVAEVGYPHATTKTIAAAAGVAEGTIYRHFPDKHALFLAAVVDANAPVVAWMAALPGRAGQGTVAGNLGEALEQLARLREQMLPLELAMLTDPGLAERRRAGAMLTPTLDVVDGGGRGLPEPNPPALLAEYLAAEQRLGRVRVDLDPAATAVTILATLIGLALVPGPGGPTPIGAGKGGQVVSDPGLDPTLLAAAIDVLTAGLVT